MANHANTRPLFLLTPFSRQFQVAVGFNRSVGVASVSRCRSGHDGCGTQGTIGKGGGVAQRRSSGVARVACLKQLCSAASTTTPRHANASHPSFPPLPLISPPPYYPHPAPKDSSGSDVTCGMKLRLPRDTKAGREAREGRQGRDGEGGM